MAAPISYNATLVSRQDLSPSLAIFRIRPDEIPDHTGWFIPGQYVVLGLNNESQPELGGVRRPMSIASCPQQTQEVDFYIRFVEHPLSNNPFTHLLWQQDIGSRIHLRMRPTGHFTLEHTIGHSDPRLKIFVAAGTGLAPFICQVFSDHKQDSQQSLQQYAILHGASYSHELGYAQELHELSRTNGLHYLPTISRPQSEPPWEGDRGRVEDFFLSERIDSLESKLNLQSGRLHPEDCVIYICGLQGTIGNTIERLLPRGFVPDHRKIRRALEIDDDIPSSIFFEQYDTTPILNVRDPNEANRLRELRPR